MEMVAAARLRRAEQRIEALRPYARRDPADDPPGRRGGRRRARTCRSSQEHETSRRSACCSSPATAAWPAPSTRRSSAPASAPRARARGRGQDGRVLRVGAPRRVVADASAAGPRGGPTRASPTGPRTPTRATSPRPDGGLRRRRARPRGDHLQRLHLAADAEGHARDAAAAPAGHDPRRGRGGRRGPGRRATAPITIARSSSTSPTRRRSSRLVPAYVEISIYRALLESTASEHGARMTAMRNASENATDIMEDDLADEPRAPGGDHPGDHGSGRRAPRR